MEVEDIIRIRRDRETPKQTPAVTKKRVTIKSLIKKFLDIISNR